MSWLLVLGAGSLLLLALPPLPEPVGVLVRGGWVLLVGAAAAFQLARLLWRQRHLLLAQLGARPARAPPDYVAGLFDAYAPSYDEHLLVDLGYAAPNLLRDLVGTRLDRPEGARVLDLGCGTGVLGPLFQRIARRLDGVDLSAEMLGRARARGVYDALHRADLVEFLARTDGRYELCLAADVLVYVGDLRPVMTGVARVLEPGGLFAFTVEHGAAESWALRRSGRYAHGSGYVRETAAASGFAVVAAKEAVLRREAGRAVAGDLYLLRRGPALEENCTRSDHRHDCQTCPTATSCLTAGEREDDRARHLGRADAGADRAGGTRVSMVRSPCTMSDRPRDRLRSAGVATAAGGQEFHVLERSSMLT
ncbi:MAG TPA: methyltransferase domain-containing protein [Geminicoccaceae bacterium]|nr:methyltransferase domain-containing protein [Geminicoccaceae bacterium]